MPIEQRKKNVRNSAGENFGNNWNKQAEKADRIKIEEHNRDDGREDKEVDDTSEASRALIDYRILFICKSYCGQS